MFSLDSKTTDEFSLPRRRQPNGLLPKDPPPVPPTTGHGPRDSRTISRTGGRGNTLLSGTSTSISSKNKTENKSKVVEEEGEFAFLRGLIRPTPTKSTEILLSSTTPGKFVSASLENDGNSTALLDPALLAAASAAGVVSSPTTATVAGNFDKRSWTDEDDVGSILASLHTSDDAINFFARYGSETPLKFVHLEQARDLTADKHPRRHQPYLPYDLVVLRTVPDANSEHYIMSSAGIVHNCPGQPSECISLASFMRQAMLFKILRNIPFYKYYLQRKTFNAWRDNARYQQFVERRQRLANRVFYVRRNTCEAIVAAKKHLLDVQSVRLMNLDMKTLPIEDFVTRQMKVKNDASAQFDTQLTLIDGIATTVHNELSATLHVLKQEDASSANFADAANDKAKSMVRLKEEKEQRKEQRKRARIELDTSPQFVRFLDYLTVEALVFMAIDVSKGFLEELGKSRKAGVFLTTVKFMELTPQQIAAQSTALGEVCSMTTVFDPDCNRVSTELNRLLDSIVECVGSVARVYYNNKVKLSSSHAPNIQSLVRENQTFREVSTSIQEKVVRHFREAEELAYLYQDPCKMYEFNKQWRVDRFRTEEHEIAELKSLLEKFGSWQRDLEKIRNRPVGILELESNNLKSILSPLLEQRLQEVKDYIKDHARLRCAQILEKYKSNLAKLANKSGHLKEFANHVHILLTMRDEEKSLYKTTSQVDQMYNLLQQYDVKVPSEDLVLHEDLHDRQMEYRKEVDVSQAYCDSKMPEMVVTVDNHIVKLQDQVSHVLSKLDDTMFTSADFFADSGRVVGELSSLGNRLDGLDQLARTYSSYQKLFNVTISPQDELARGKERLDALRSLWEMIERWSERYSFWLESQFTELRVEEIEKDVREMSKDSYALHKRLNSKASGLLKDKLAEFISLVPTILDLGNPNIKTRHWERLFLLISENYHNEMPFSLSMLLKGGIIDHKDEVGDISGAASGEAQLEASLEKIRTEWEHQAFTVLNHRDQHGLFILGSLEEIFLLLEDHQVSLQTMLGSKYVRGVQDRVEEWEKRLATLSETLDEWMNCQRTWMYLENIFGAEDIQKQLPAESQKFLIVDRSWKSIMNRTQTNPRVLSALQPLDNGSTLLDTFVMNNEALEQIQKSLEDYLETKRMAFPRFYFLSNDELLEIMSQTRDPHAVQPHMSKCFDAIKRIRFGEGRHANEILGFVDPAGEFVPLVDSVKAEGPVETWLGAFEAGMRKALYTKSKQAFEHYPNTQDGAIQRSEWLWTFPAQVVIAVDQVIWTYNMTQSLLAMDSGGFGGPGATNPNALNEFLEFSLRQIDAMVALVRAPLDKLQRTLLCALLTIDVHARDVVRSMIARGVSNLSEFEWTKQLRYYWQEAEDDIFARQTNASFRYGYEYLGNGPRLVITPLTDICYMTLTGALHMKLGGAPAGPAGTGKTETTKDLAKALAVYCVVFNCSDGLDFKIMGRFFSGLAQQGAWSCFDEFNRIDIEVLSVIAQQILCIQQAITKEVAEFDFEGQMIPLNPAFGVFITMNPGYAGRTELPDNLKSLFRPVAMMVPDYRLIAEIMLFAEGFANALPLSNKMAQLYALSSEQLSKQSHYDFGMRAVKSVLVAAGQLKRKEPETNEDILLIRAMRDSNVPKFLEQDLPLFGGILSDLFPGIKVPFVDYGRLQTAIERTLDSQNLQRVPSFITKTIQVHETQLVRHGMMVVGEAGSGKSTNLRVLASALGSLYDDKVNDKDGMYRHVDRLVLNPKSITAGELYGEFNLMTGEWKDGIVPKLVRDCVNALNEGSDHRKWVIFDGPVDAVWIENMNTVLDDNKTLCLANSERIKMPSTLHMIFEVQDLKVASPATVSRCGMVYMEQIHVGMLSLVRSWASTVCKELIGSKATKSLVVFIEAHIEAAIEFIRRECQECVATSNNQLVTSLLNMIDSQLRAETDAKLLGQDSDLMHALTVWCFAWSVGGNLNDNSRAKYCEWSRQRFSSILSTRFNEILVDVYSCVVDLSSKVARQWNNLVNEWSYDVSQPYFSILVPTVDTTRYRFLLEKLSGGGHSVLFMGETGVGKSVVISSTLTEAATAGQIVTYTMGYSAQTKPSNLRDVLETKLEKKRKNLLGPPAGRKMMLFVDDINMPALETYGAQPPNELLRQVIDQGGFYDTHKLFFKAVQDVIVIAACAPPGGGRNEVSPRLMRHFNMIWMCSLSESSMCRIFASILGGFLASCTTPSVASMASSLVTSSVTIYQQIQRELLPTPTRSHYTFNLRDLSKVFQGMLRVRPTEIQDEDGLRRLWAHESSRVFRDRLIDDSDRQWLNQALLTQLQGPLGATTWELSNFVDVIYGDFMERGTKDYVEVSSRAAAGDRLVDALEEYNITFSSRMDLVFFNDAIDHVARIARVLSQPRGNALLVGVGGSGRQSLTRMASFMADYKCRQIEITRGYGIKEWHEALKDILITAGAKNQPTVFLFSDTQIVHETFLEDLNNVLNSGEVPNLYEADELERIVAAVRPLAKAVGMETRDAILAHYTHLVRENLHVVLCMSPIGSGFRTRCRMFPSLVNCCTIDWFAAWPEDALYSVAERMFQAKKGNLQSAGCDLEPFIGSLSTLCNRMHRTVEEETVRYLAEQRRYNYTTPTSYLELVRLYMELLQKQQEKTRDNEHRYRIGLEKIHDTEGIVAKLEVTLTEMQPVLAKAAEETAILLVQVAADQKEADSQAALVEVEVAEANIEAAEVTKTKEDCEADLELAMPAYRGAVQALASLDRRAIQELRAFNNPPELVKFTMEAVCILLDVPPNWQEAKRIMSAMDFMDQLRNYDKDHIAPKTIRKVEKYFNDPRFLPTQLQSVSSAACCMCEWVRAIVNYDRVAKMIEPKKAKLAAEEAKLETTMAALATKKAALQVVLDKVAGLQRSLRETEQRKADLATQVATAEKQIERAGQLLGGLGGEKVRWLESAEVLRKSMANLVGDMCLAAGCLAYLGPFTSQFRQRILAQWLTAAQDLNIPCGVDFSLVGSLAVPVVLRSWQIDGLPADNFSSENGLLTTMGRRWPLMIDPQGQANRWVRNTYASKNLQVIKLTEKDFLRTLENAVRYGAPVLLENVGEELDPSLEPLLLRQVFKRSGQLLIRLGDSDIPYSEEFRFFITTKLANPHYMPEVCVKVTVINFTVTSAGLEDQLLVDVIKSERPDLEARRDQLVVSIANDQRQLVELEEQILSMLAAASGNILDDEELINALARSKKTSVAINGRLAEAEATTTEINGIREGYRVVATRGSVIYFVVASLASADPMYQYSLQYYKDLFNARLARTEKVEQVEKRLEILLEDITRSVFSSVCRGLFEKDKLLYAFCIASAIEQRAGTITAVQSQAMLVGPVIEESVIAAAGAPPTGWDMYGLSEKAWGAVLMLAHDLPEIFSELPTDMREKTSSWAEFMTCEQPYSIPLPGDWDDRLSPNGRLLLLRYLREEKLVFATRAYVEATLGTTFVESLPFDLEGAYTDSSAVTPLIFILSPGADPTDYLLQLADAKGKGGGLRIISLGQGQGPIAERAIDFAQRNGDWICLQNCHLAVSWLPRLEQLVERMQAEAASNGGSHPSIHPDFRLWLTSMPSSAFPVPVLQNGLKVTNEPPRGIRANLLRTFSDISEDDYESSTKAAVVKKLLFAIAFFNALILERRKFGAVGWNIPYDWMNSDLKAAITQARMYVEEQLFVPWETLNVSVSDLTYGGRVTDRWDKRCISSILRKYFTPRLLEDEFTFTSDGIYYAPPEGDLGSVREYIRSLPFEDSPSLFGLHSNASISFQQKESRALLSTTIACSGGGGGGSSSGGADVSNDSKVLEIASRLSSRLPKQFDLRSAHVSTFRRVGDAMNSLGVFLTQELIRFNGLLEVMASTLFSLRRAIRGEVVMSGELEVMYNCFVYQRVPPAWEEVGYPCLKPLLSWIEDFLARIVFLQLWLVEGPRPAYWLSGFFFPQGFMTAVKQTYSRDQRIAVDTLSIGCEMTPLDASDLELPPETGAYVYGLYMEGGRFNRTSMNLEDSAPRVLLDILPCIWLKPVITEEYHPVGVYDCPLYKTSIRAGTLSTTGHSTNFVVSLPIPSSQESDHWVRRGCAMLCMSDD